MKIFNKNELLIKCCNCRKNILQLTYNMGSVGAHIGGALSLVEIMNVLYSNILNVGINGDKLIFSKGHGALALYTAMYEAKIINEDDLFSFKKNGSDFSAHPHMNSDKMIEFSAGSLGQGLSFGVGVAIAFKKRSIKNNVFVIVGDGECNEGQVWEAAQAASHFKLNNIVVIVDNNFLQYDGTTEEIMSNKPFASKWDSFGFFVQEIDGHNLSDIYSAFKTLNIEKPNCIIANTIKGKGVSFMENECIWHNHSLTKEQYELALNEIENEYNR